MTVFKNNFVRIYWKDFVFSLLISWVLTHVLDAQKFVDFVGKSGSDLIQIFGTFTWLLLACQAILITSVKLNEEKLQLIKKKLFDPNKDPKDYMKELKRWLIQNILWLFLISFIVFIVILSYSFINFTNHHIILSWFIWFTLFLLTLYVVLAFSFLGTFLKFQEIFVIDVD